ncbi:hypothetical protein BBJ28_00024991 [Nothophytophthora sp. Chile5]|nr:hypothetical protein BBJ28_00024991 [Nothophytophthora sp. Chile5]
MREQMGSLSAADERLTAASSFQALQTLIRRIFQPTSVKELFVSVSSTFAQILHGSSAILFLFDPSSNELWTQREESQLIQVPASLGISGSTLSSGATLLITDVLADPRFHPMVDQFVLSGLRQAEPASTLLLTPSRLAPETTKATIGIADSLTIGVLIVEQMLFEMLRNCRDRVSARAPAKFAKLFKQNKNWRKYYAAVERKASGLEGKLRDVLDHREQLLLDQKTLQERHQLVQNRLEASERNSKDVGKQVVVWKKKLSKWQMLLDAKDRAISEKTSELEEVAAEFARYRRDRRSKDLQSVLLASKDCSNSQVGGKRQPFEEEGGEVKAFSDLGRLSLLRADQTRLKSQLVRAEADNLLLVKAISIARNQHGELPRTIQAEVTRVATRVSLRSSSDE